MKKETNNSMEIVRAIGELNIRGTLIDDGWLEALKYENGKVNVNACLILSEIIYWYRPSIQKDEVTGQVIGINKKFHADKLQKNYEDLGNRFGLTKRQAKAAVKYLEDKDLITTEFRHFTADSGMYMSNVLYIEPVVENVKAISIMHKSVSPKGEHREQNEETDHVTLERQMVLRSNVTHMALERQTYTKTNPEITNKEIYTLAEGENPTPAKAGECALDEKEDPDPSHKEPNLTIEDNVRFDHTPKKGLNTKDHLPIHDHRWGFDVYGFINGYMKNLYWLSYPKRKHKPITHSQATAIEDTIMQLISKGLTIDDWLKATECYIRDLPKNNDGDIRAFLKASKRFFDIDLTDYS